MRSITILPFFAGYFADNCDEVKNDFENSVVECRANQLKISIDSCAFKHARFHDPGNAFMAGPNFASYAAGESNTCKPAVSDDGTEYYFNINDDLRDCDTLVTNNGTHVTYEQAVQYVSGTSNSVITRVRRMKVNFTCIFDLEVTLTMEHAVKPIVEHFEVDMGNTVGTFDVSMGLYTDVTYSSLVTGEFEIDVSDILYVGVYMDEESTMLMQLQSCWATPSSDAKDTTQYTFIDDFCGDDDEINVYQSLEVFQNGQSSDARFSLEAFSFQSNNGGEVYLHCMARICDPESETCEPDCSLDRKRRNADMHDGNTIITSIGPVTIRP